MHKNYICTLLAAMLLISTVGCGGADTETVSAGSETVPTTETVVVTEPERQPYIGKADYGGTDFHILSASHFKENYFDDRTDAEYAPDSVFLPAVRELYEQGAADGAPYFSFSVSYQNHGKYSDTELCWDGEYISHAGLSDSAYYTVNNYFGGVADTCERLYSFIDSFRDDEAPVVIVLFGDHKPTLGDGNADYGAIGVNLTRATAEGFENYYATPYLIWANDAAKAATGGDFTGEGPVIGPYFLMNEVFSQCGYDGPAFMRVSRALEAQVQVLHSTEKYMARGDLLTSLPEGAAQAENDFACAEYYLRKKYRG